MERANREHHQSARERLRALLVKEPVLISLTLRWFGWLIALIVVVIQGAPKENLEGGLTALVVTALVLCAITVYPYHIRPKMPESFGPYLWPPLDCLIAVWSIYYTGGWDSPFYHFAVTVVLAPSLQFGLSGALLSSSFFTTLFLLAVHHTPLGFSPAFTTAHELKPDIVSTPLNPLMIGLYAAFLGEVLNKLRTETERSKILAAENERARMSRDIHDGVSQTLFMLTMSLENGSVLADKESAPRTQSHIEKLIPVARKALIELRNAMHGIEAFSEGRQSFSEAVTHLARDYQSATALKIDVERDENFQEPTTIASPLFLMLQEALSNACQHSEGSLIRVCLLPQKISVVDNGRGFDSVTVKPGRGLKNLEQRAQEVEICLQVESTPEGTSVTMSWNEEAP